MPAPPTENPLLSLRQALAFDARDWSLDKRDAWLWGVIHGWDDDSLPELIALHGWTPETVTRVKRLAARFAEAVENDPNP